MSPYRQRFLVHVCCVTLLLLSTTGCLGQDFLDLPLSLTEMDHGWLAAIEPDEQIDIGLTGIAAYPEIHWQIAEFDPEVLLLKHQHHETARPPSGDPEATEPGLYDPGSSISRSGFTFAGVAAGETPLRFEFIVAGETIDIAEYTVAVVADACAAETAAVANRCGDGFSFHPQDGPMEWDHGTVFPVESGGGIDVMLMANALYPDVSWKVVEFDASVIAVEGPQALGAARSPGDWSEVDPDSRHSFLPVWSFPVRGVALGESALVLEISIDGTRIDLYEIAVAVVEDADAFAK